MMKKSVVLFISLLFISALSLLIVQNLDDTNTYIEEQNIKLNKIQVLSLFSSAKDAAFKVINRYEDDLEEEKALPFTINDINIAFSLLEYNKPDINAIYNDNEESKKLENIFLSNDINDFDLFKEVYDDYKNEFSSTIGKKKVFEINNNKQVNDIINTYINRSYSQNKNNIKNKIGFFTKDDKSKRYVLKLYIDYLNNRSKAYYILTKTEVEYFEINFK